MHPAGVYGRLMRGCRRLVSVSLWVLVVGAVSACGSSDVRTVTVRTPARVAPARLSLDPVSETATAATRRGGTVRRSATTWRTCDANVRARRPATSCVFAENVFYGFWRAAGGRAFKAYSPVTGRHYAVSCTSGRRGVICRAGNGAAARFPRAAVAAYTASAARQYCVTHHVSPGGRCGVSTSVPSGRGASDSPAVGADLAGSADSATPSADEDDYSNHDGNYNGAPTTEDFGSGKGSVGVCADGTYSDSIGRSGACSHHGGVG